MSQPSVMCYCMVMAVLFTQTRKDGRELNFKRFPSCKGGLLFCLPGWNKNRIQYCRKSQLKASFPKPNHLQKRASTNDLKQQNKFTSDELNFRSNAELAGTYYVYIYAGERKDYCC